MAGTKRGMGANPLAAKAGAEGAAKRTGPGGARRGSGLVVALRSEAVDAGVRRVSVAQTVPNPDNPAERSEVLDQELLDSIRQIGVLVPLVVMSRESFVAVRPEHAEAVGAAEWVVLAGHRRRRHALEAGVEEVDAVVRDDLEERVDEVVIAENVHRADLRPIQEALAYHRVIERRGLSQRKAAEHLGIAQGQISKRLRLLQLPESVWPLVDQGELDIASANQLLDRVERAPEAVRDRVRDLVGRVCEAVLADDEVRGQWSGMWSWQLLNAASSATTQAVDEAAHEAARQVADAEGVPVVLDPGSKWKGMERARELSTKKEIEAARKNGELVVGANRHGDPKFYSTAAPAKGAEGEGAADLSPYEAERRDAERQRKAAMKARRAFVEDQLQRPAFVRSAREMVTLCVVTGTNVGDAAAKVAIKLRATSGIGPEPVKGETWGWRRDLATARDRDKVAALMALGGLEDRASWPHASWADGATVEYLEWLVAQGYEPTEWETTQVAEGRRRLDGAADETLDDVDESDRGAGDGPGDSVESPHADGDSEGSDDAVAETQADAESREG